MTTTPRTPTRSQVRLFHLAFAAVTLGVVYSPAFDAEGVRTLLRLAVIPGLGLTGVALWALPKLRHALASRERRTSAHHETTGRSGRGR